MCNENASTINLKCNETNLYKRTSITVLHQKIDLALTKVLPPHNTLDHDMILTDAIHGLTALHIDLHIDLLIDTTLVLDIDHAPITETLIL